MPEPSRDDRLQTDLAALQSLDAASTVFSLETTGDPPDRYTITFSGKGLGRDASSQSDVALVELHRIDLRMPYAYPQSPPDIRWITPIMHPNVSFSGFVNLADIGIVWTRELPIELVVERLWDVARGEFLNHDKATNYAAKNWYEKECQFELPVDRRSLRDASASAASNIVRYQRRGARSVQLAGAASDVMFIDENTPTPPVPQRKPVPRRRRGGDEDVMYIGPESP
ncbi:MAG: ubiquitin-conjugating enzyme E2 [Pirellulaceae bacterium]